MCGPRVALVRAHIVFAHFLKNGHQGRWVRRSLRNLNNIFSHVRVFCNSYCTKTIGPIKMKFSHNVPLMYENFLSIFRTNHATQRPLVAVFQKVSKNNMCSHSWAAHNKYLEMNKHNKHVA